MENGNLIEKLASQFGQSASVKNVFGESVQAGAKTIIPVAQIAYGVGGGRGQGRKKNSKRMYAEPGELKDADGVVSEGGGAGGGIYAKPKGVYEITSTSTRFIPASNTQQILIAVAIGFIVSGLFKRSKKR